MRYRCLRMDKGHETLEAAKPSYQERGCEGVNHGSDVNKRLRCACEMRSMKHMTSQEEKRKKEVSNQVEKEVNSVKT